MNTRTCARGNYWRRHCHKNHVVEEEPFDLIGGHRSAERHYWVDAGCDGARRVSDWVVLNEENASKQDKGEINDVERITETEEEMEKEEEQLMDLVVGCP